MLKPGWRPPGEYSRAPGRVAGGTLSVRELECLGLAAEGLSNKMIADKLVISEGTVKTHIRHVLTKLEAGDRTHAVVRAIEEGYFTVEVKSPNGR